MKTPARAVPSIGARRISRRTRPVQSAGLVFWNVENLFHPETGGPRADYTAADGWTPDLYERKLGRIAETLAALGESPADGASREPRQIVGAPKRRPDHPGPALIALAEVENLRVAADLAARLPGYDVARPTAETPDYLDTLLLFDAARFESLEATWHSFLARSSKGDFLEVALRHRASGETLFVYVCHFKSRHGGDAYTEPFRACLCDHLQTLLFRRHAASGQAFVVCGDFNDEPFGDSLITYLLGSWDREFVAAQQPGGTESLHLYNCAFERLLAPRAGSLHHLRRRGTPWTLFDQFLVAPPLLRPDAPFRYAQGSFRIHSGSTADGGGRPRRTSTWDEQDRRVFTDGYSDHFPVGITLDI